jgi:hypothetical protein
VKTNSSHIARFLFVLLAAGLLVMAVASCGTTTTITLSPTVTLTSTLPATTPPPPPPPATPPAMKALRIIPPVPYNLLIGFDIPFVASGVYTDNSFKDVSDIVTWKSSNPAVASIDKLGKLTGKTAGETIVTASYGSIVSQESFVTVVIPGGAK